MDTLLYKNPEQLYSFHPEMALFHPQFSWAWKGGQEVKESGIQALLYVSVLIYRSGFLPV